MDEYVDIDVSAALLEEPVEIMKYLPGRAADPAAALRLDRRALYARGNADRWIERAGPTLRPGGSA